MENAVFVLSVALVVESVVAVIPAAGKCNPCNVTTVPLRMDYFEQMKPWKLLYVTAGVPFEQADSIVRDGNKITDYYYTATDYITLNDDSQVMYNYTMKIVNNIIIEDTVDKDGQALRFYVYPLAITNHDGLLFYRCSDNGELDVDTRYIWVPANETLTDSEVEYFLKIDCQCNFRGQLNKLPEIFYKPL